MNIKMDKQMYNNPVFEKGFELIEQGSAEKEMVAGYLSEMIGKRSAGTGNYDVLDLGAGSGRVWKHLLDGTSLSAYSLDLVDSAESRIKKAQKLFDGNSNVVLHHRDARTFLEECGKEYHCITAIHFLSCLDSDRMQESITAALKLLKKGGFLFIVQPAQDSGLSLCKDLLYREFCLGERKYNRFKSCSLPSACRHDTDYASLKVTISDTDLDSLAGFLLGSEYTNNLAGCIDQKRLMRIFSPFRADEHEYSIDIKNEYIIIEKTDE